MTSDSYPGGKGSSYQKIINQIPPHKVFIEPFLGGGAVMANKLPAMLNIGVDINENVLSLTAGSIATSSDACRHTPPEMAMGAAIARNGITAVPPEMAMGAATARNGITAVPPEMAMGAATARNYLFMCADAVEFLREYQFTGNEFIYCDPPYLMSTRKQQRAIYAHEFATEAEHTSLLTLLREIPCKIALSGYFSELYADMLRGWHTYTFESQTRSGKTATEWLWMNYPPPNELHDYRFLGDNYRQRERI